MCRPILCCNCSHWDMSSNNIEMGSCILEQEDKIIENVTWYNSKCIYGISEEV